MYGPRPYDVRHLDPRSKTYIGLHEVRSDNGIADTRKYFSQLNYKTTNSTWQPILSNKCNGDIQET